MSSPTTLLTDVRVITGDGVTDIANGWVLLAGPMIAEVGAGDPDIDPSTPGLSILSLPSQVILPGVVNAHAHGCTTGPLFSSGAAALDVETARSNADRHLSQGVTTLVNVCGLGLPEDLTALSDHPLRIRLGTTHFPEALVAAHIVDGAGLDEAHEAMTAERMIDLGAGAIGEVGSGATLGGGVAAYRYLPLAAQNLLGRQMSPAVATDLIDALVGTDRLARPDTAALRRTLSDRDLLPAEPDRATAVVAGFAEAIERYAQRPVRHSLATFAAAAGLSARTGIPAVFHTAAPSVERLLDVARAHEGDGSVLVAGHMNHTSMTVTQAVDAARRLRDLGVVIDVSVLDTVRARRLAGPELVDALTDEGLVDTLSTDYAGGAWESMLAAAQRQVDRGALSAAEVVRMCTGRPAEVFATAADGRGLIAPRRPADLVIAEAGDLAAVRSVWIDGHPVWQAAAGRRLPAD